MVTRAFRRIHVTAPYGRLIHEIRLSFFEGRWQARVVTLPNHIWVEPGGRRALVFESEVAEEAEAMAASFIQKDCVARGHKVADLQKIVERPSGGDQSRRRPGRYPVEYAPRGAGEIKGRRRQRSATTENLSETGLFIVTEDPLPPGARLDIDLRLPGLAARLEGVVIWSRRQAARGLETGMGVRLLDPSLSYRALIQTLG